MAYRIEYDGKNGKYEIRPVSPRRIPLLLGCAAAGILLWTLTTGDPGVQQLWDALVPGENAVTIHAVQTMAEDLRNGASIGDAVQVFCMEVIHGTQGSD